MTRFLGNSLKFLDQPGGLLGSWVMSALVKDREWTRDVSNSYRDGNKTVYTAGPERAGDVHLRFLAVRMMEPRW